METLPEILAGLWNELRDGARDRRHGYHLPVLATLDQAERPTARTVVLRAVDPTDRTLCCHSDRRSPKVAEIRRRPWAAWTFYDPERRIQVRARGPIEVLVPEADPVAAEAWEQTALPSRRCYLAPRAPSEIAEVPSANLPPAFRDANPDEAASTAGRQNFCVLRCTVASFDWLRIRHDGHLRVSFAWDEDDRLSARWLEP